MSIRGIAYPRAALVGNPSDGYFGKTIAFTFSNFVATVILDESATVTIRPGPRDQATYASLDELAGHVRRHGYYGGQRLLVAAVKQFHDYSVAHALRLHDRNFTLGYETTIPPQVGLAGSSALITACFRALMSFYAVTLPAPVLANLVRATEVAELGIPAGLQDRVAQAYNGLVYMDFRRDLLDRQGCGRYEYMDLKALPPMYIAWRAEWAEGTEIFHNDIRARWNNGEPMVVDAMSAWASLTDQVRDLLARGEGHKIGPLLNANFDLRRKIYRIDQGNIRLVETARAAGASANFTGSGGAIVGAYTDEAMFLRLEKALAGIGAKILKPDFVAPSEAA